VTAAVYTWWPAGGYGCDLLGDSTLAAAWEFVHRRCDELAAASIELELDATSPRTGVDVEARLRECSRYDPELDLALLADDGTVAGW
jgi:hypothetical protein